MRANWSLLGHRVGLMLLATVMSLAAMIAIGSAQARAADGSLSMELDTGVINLGTDPGTNGINIIVPGTDSPATLSAALTDTGQVSTPQAFSFPSKTIEGLDASGFTVDATIEISATSTVTGSFDQTTGAADISIPSQALISVYLNPKASNPDPLGICKVSGFTLGFSTTGVLQDPGDPSAIPPRPAHNYDASVFTPPPGDGSGAMTSAWASLPASTEEGGTLPTAVCPAVNDLVGGPGGLWLSGTATASSAPVQVPPSKAPQITTEPALETGSTIADFAFEQGVGEDQPVNKFQCRIDSADESAWVACGSGSTSGTRNYADLMPGQHEFEVRAGNDFGYGPVSGFQWTIITAPTEAPAITASPPEQTTETSADFAFSAGGGEGQPVTKFQCKLDGAVAWADCDSGSQSYSGLAVGSHTFDVRAGNDAGYGPAATRAWTINKVTPPPTCEQDPSQPKCQKTCEQDPSQPKCQKPPPPGKAKFGGLKVKPKTVRVKRGKKATFKVRVKNVGNASAKRAKVCLKAPKKQIKPVGRKCKKLGSLAAGKARTIKFKVKLIRKAKRGKKYRLTFVATARKTAAVRAKAKVKVK